MYRLWVIMLRNKTIRASPEAYEYKPMFVSKLPVILSVAESEEESFSKLIDDHDEAAIDKRVYELYGLTEEEANYLENW